MSGGIKILLVFLVIFFWGFFSVVPALAIKVELEVPVPGVRLTDIACEPGETCGDGGIPWLAQYISGIFRFGVGIAAILAVIMMLVAGFIWLTSGGNPGQIGKAKDFISSSLLGLSLALFSYIILYTINPQLVTLKSIGVVGITPESLTWSQASTAGAITNILRSDISRTLPSRSNIADTLGLSGLNWRNNAASSYLEQQLQFYDGIIRNYIQPISYGSDYYHYTARYATTEEIQLLQSQNLQVSSQGGISFANYSDGSTRLERDVTNLSDAEVEALRGNITEFNIDINNLRNQPQITSRTVYIPMPFNTTSGTQNRVLRLDIDATQGWYNPFR